MAQGWFVGSALIGSIVGVLCGGALSDYAGRKATLIVSAILFTTSAVGCALSGSFNELVVYRIVGGVGIGVVSVVSPLYISEIAFPQYRGRLVSLYQLAITIGFLVAYIANFGVLSFSKSADSSSMELLNMVFIEQSWRAMLGLEVIPAAIFLIIILAIPESPRWLILKGGEVKALNIFKRLYNSDKEAAMQVSSVKNAVENGGESKWKALFSKGMIKALLIGSGVAILGQFMGINAVLYYGPTIFQSSGMNGGDSLYYQVFIGLINVATTILALYIIDKVGRKTLIYYGVSGMVLFLLLIATIFSFGQEWQLPSVVTLICFLGYIFCCAISISAVVFVLLFEMYPTRVRGMAMSVAGFALWVGTYIVGQLTPWMLEVLSPSGTFLLFAVACIPYMLIIWKLVPETTGRTLEEIESYWKK